MKFNYIGLLLLIFIFLLDSVTTSKNRTVRNSTSARSLNGVTNKISKRSQNGDTLIDFLASNDLVTIEVDNDKLPFSLDGITIYDLSDDQTTFKFRLAREVTLADFIKIKSNEEINARFVELTNQKGFSFNKWGDMEVKFVETQGWLGFALYMAPNYQDIFIELSFRQNSIPLADYLSYLGFENQEDIINIDDMRAHLWDDEEVGYLKGRISHGGIWNFLVTPSNFPMNNGLLCAKVGKGDQRKTSCAFFAKWDKETFNNFVGSYASTISSKVSALPIPEDEIIVYSTKETLKYSDTDSNLKLELTAMKTDGEMIYSEIIGGNDFHTMKVRVQLSSADNLQITNDKYRQILLDCKIFANKFEMKFFPSIPVTTNTIKKFVPEGRLKEFFTNDFDSTSLLLENYEIIGSNKICVSMKHAVNFTIIKDKYVIKNTTMKFCEEAGELKFSSGEFNEEKNFNTSMLINIANDPDGGKMKISGAVRILDAERLIEVIEAKFMSASYEAVFSHLKQFPLVTLSQSHKLGTNYIRFDGVALFNEKQFNLQAVYIFSGVMQGTSPLALCLEKKLRIKNDDGEEVDAPSLKLVDFLEYLLVENNLGIGSVTKFNKVLLSFQQNAQFYSTLQNDDSLKCKSLANTVIEQEEFGADIPQIFMSASDVDYRCNDGTDSDKKLCAYLKNSLGYASNDFGSNKFYGFLRPDQFKLHSKFPLSKVFAITQGLSLEGMDGEGRSLAQTIEWQRSNAVVSDDESEEDNTGNIIEGYLTKNNLRDQLRLQAKLHIMEDKIFFSVKDTPDPRPETGFLGIAFVNEVTLRSIRHEIPTEGDIHLEFHSDLQIGSIASSAINIRGNNDGLTGQYLYGSANQNRLFACLPQLEEKPLTEVFDAFGISLSREMFTSLMISHICFTYTPEESWNIESRGITAQQGLWLHAKTKIHAKNVYGRMQDFFVDVKMKCTGDNKQILIEQPPLFFYEIPDLQITPSGDAVNRIEEKNYKVSITYSNTSKDTGPTLEINLNGNAISDVALKGYVSTIAFESPAEFSVDSTNFQNLEFVQPEKKSSKKSETVPLLGEGFQMTGIWRKGNSFQDSTFEFKFSGDRLVPFALTAYNNLVESKKAFYLEKKNGHSELKSDVESKLVDPAKKASKKNELNKMLKEIQLLKRSLFKEENKKFLPCTELCKAMLSPGFVWDNCHVSDRLGNISCLHFKKNALKSCDMPCLAKCEIARVDATEKSKQVFKEINAKARNLAKRSVQTSIHDQLLTDVEPAKTLFQTSITEFSTDLDTLNTNLQSLNEGGFPFSSIGTDWVDFAEFSKSTKLDFKLGLSNGGEEIYQTIVDGALPTRIAEYYLKKLHNDRLQSIEKKEENVQNRYGDVLEVISNWKVANRDQILKEKRKRPVVKKAKSKKKSKSKKERKSKKKGESKERSYENVSIRQNPSSLYHEESLSSNYLIRSLAPWNTLRNNNPFIKDLPVNSNKRLKISKSASVCTNRRNQIRDYKDIIAYMGQWNDAYVEARKYLDESSKRIKYGMNDIKTKSAAQKRSMNNDTNNRRDEVQSKWVNRLQSGFNTWQNEFNRQLNNFYTMGPKMMTQEINAIFTPQGFDSLQSYIQSTSGGKLRSIQSDDSLNKLGEYLLNGLASMKTLGDNSNFITQMKSLIGQLEHQGCHDEL